MEVVWQVTDDNSTVIDVGRVLGEGCRRETLGMGEGKQWWGNVMTKHASLNPHEPFLSNTFQESLLVASMQLATGGWTLASRG